MKASFWTWGKPVAVAVDSGKSSVWLSLEIDGCDVTIFVDKAEEIERLGREMAEAAEAAEARRKGRGL